MRAVPRWVDDVAGDEAERWALRLQLVALDILEAAGRAREAQAAVLGEDPGAFERAGGRVEGIWEAHEYLVGLVEALNARARSRADGGEGER